MPLIYQGYSYDSSTECRTGFLVEDSDGTSIAWFEEEPYAKNYITMRDQLDAAIKRAEAAEAALAAVPRQAIDALFRQQFGSYPVWFNEMWTPIADWLGYKPARR